ncbi:MAG: hypothetical protein KDN05_04280 [Verrucomicrobiae bacterium]|nr:hypothetical protein [Verrucomicrobiae bacterium]
MKHAALTLALAVLLTLIPSVSFAGGKVKYHVYLILDRVNTTDEIWDGAWKAFRDTALPGIRDGFGPGKFDVDVDQSQAVFTLWNLHTDDFTATKNAFQAIPSQLPSIPEMKVSVDGPYRGDPYFPGGDLILDGKGNDSTGTKVKKRVGLGEKWKVKVKIQNDTDVAQRFKIDVSGDLLKKNRSGCQFKLKADSRAEKRGKGTIYTPVLPPNTIYPMVCTVVVAKEKPTSRSYTAKIVSKPAELGSPNRAQLICRPNY